MTKQINSQVDKKGNVSIWKNGIQYQTGTRVPREHLLILNQIRRDSQGDEQEKFIVRMKRYEGDIPESLTLLGTGLTRWSQ